MEQEVEVKFLDADLATVRRLLAELGAQGGEPYFESNAVYDDPGRSLRAADVLLRLRTGPTNVLTLKVPPEKADPRYKIYDERQTEVAEPEAMAGILAGLGYEVAFRYEKVRETWEFEGCTVCLDRLPFGEFVEIEGPREAIYPLAGRLGLEEDAASTRTYHALNLAWREEKGLPPDESFVFSQAQRRELGVDSPDGLGGE
jgi:adenylate cyclase class 2